MRYQCVATDRMRSWSIILEKGADVVEALEVIAREKNIKAAAVVSAVGSLNKALLRNPKAPMAEESEFTVKKEIPCPIVPEGSVGIIELRGAMELLSLEGNITVKEGKIIAHLHASVSNNRGQVFGGGLCLGSTVYRQLEVFLLEYEDLDIIRVPSPDGFFNIEIQKT